MKASELRDILIPAINEHTGSPIIQGDQIGDKPEIAHATFKFTTPYGRGVGQAEEIPVIVDGVYTLRRKDEFQTVISFTAFAMNDDESVDLAQSIHDWFSFYGVDILQNIGIAVVDQTNVTNRDAFVIEDYERRNGFDVILRITRIQDLEVNWIETVQIDTEKGGNTE